MIPHLMTNHPFPYLLSPKFDVSELISGWCLKSPQIPHEQALGDSDEKKLPLNGGETSDRTGLRKGWPSVSTEWGSNVH